MSGAAGRGGVGYKGLSREGAGSEANRSWSLQIENLGCCFILIGTWPPGYLPDRGADVQDTKAKACGACVCVTEPGADVSGSAAVAQRSGDGSGDSLHIRTRQHDGDAR